MCISVLVYWCINVLNSSRVFIYVCTYCVYIHILHYRYTRLYTVLRYIYPHSSHIHTTLYSILYYILYTRTAIARSLGEDFSGLTFERSDIDQILHSLEDKDKDKDKDKVNPIFFDSDSGPESDPESEEKEMVDTGGWKRGVDVLIALHACDTATDDALFYAVQQRARVIVTSPCCHKEARRTHTKSLKQPDRDRDRNRDAGSSALDDLLKHGIFQERQLEMFTDAVRALCLEREGYDTTVLEFIGGEHTAKNVMIAGVRKKSQNMPSIEKVRAIDDRIKALMALYRVSDLKLPRKLGVLGVSGRSKEKGADEENNENNENNDKNDIPALPVRRKRKSTSVDRVRIRD